MPVTFIACSCTRLHANLQGNMAAPMRAVELLALAVA
jgi:hypothetical protein